METGLSSSSWAECDITSAIKNKNMKSGLISAMHTICITAEFPELVQRIHDEGHEAGNHM